MADNLEEKLTKELDELDNLLDSEINEMTISSEKNNSSHISTANNSNNVAETTVKKNMKMDNFNEHNNEFSLKDYVETGKKYYLKNLRIEALQNFQKALEIKPDDLTALFNIGVIYLDREEYELAMRQFERALEIKPDDYKSLCNLAGIYYKLGKLREAYDILNRAIAINPNDINSLQNMKLIEKKILHNKK